MHRSKATSGTRCTCPFGCTTAEGGEGATYDWAHVLFRCEHSELRKRREEWSSALDGATAQVQAHQRKGVPADDLLLVARMARDGAPTERWEPGCYEEIKARRVVTKCVAAVGCARVDSNKDVQKAILAAVKMGLELQEKGHDLAAEAKADDAAELTSRRWQLRVITAWFGLVKNSAPGRLLALATIRGERIRAQRIMLRLAEQRQATKADLAVYMDGVRKEVARLVAQAAEPTPAGQWANHASRWRAGAALHTWWQRIAENQKHPEGTRVSTWMRRVTHAIMGVMGAPGTASRPWPHAAPDGVRVLTLDAKGFGVRVETPPGTAAIGDACTRRWARAGPMVTAGSLKATRRRLEARQLAAALRRFGVSRRDQMCDAELKECIQRLEVVGPMTAVDARQWRMQQGVLHRSMRTSDGLTQWSAAVPGHGFTWVKGEEHGWSRPGGLGSCSGKALEQVTGVLRLDLTQGRTATAKGRRAQARARREKAQWREAENGQRAYAGSIWAVDKVVDVRQRPGCVAWNALDMLVRWVGNDGQYDDEWEPVSNGNDVTRAEAWAMWEARTGRRPPQKARRAVEDIEDGMAKRQGPVRAARPQRHRSPGRLNGLPEKGEQVRSESGRDGDEPRRGKAVALAAAPTPAEEGGGARREVTEEPPCRVRPNREPRPRPWGALREMLSCKPPISR